MFGVEDALQADEPESDMDNDNETPEVNEVDVHDPQSDSDSHDMIHEVMEEPVDVHKPFTGADNAIFQVDEAPIKEVYTGFQPVVYHQDETSMVTHLSNEIQRLNELLAASYQQNADLVSQMQTPVYPVYPAYAQPYHSQPLWGM